MPDTRALVDAFFDRLAGERGESLFDNVGDIQFWMKDASGRYVRVNAALLKNYGFSDSAAVLGRTDDELFPPHLADQYMRDDRAVLSGSPLRDRIELVARPDRTAAWHVTNKIPLRGRDGRAVGTAGTTRDLDRGGVAATTASRLEPVVAHLHAHLESPLEKRRHARAIGLSVRSLERRFRAAFGVSMLQFQRTLRMRKACQLLVAGVEPITHRPSRSAMAESQPLHQGIRPHLRDLAQGLPQAVVDQRGIGLSARARACAAHEAVVIAGHSCGR